MASLKGQQTLARWCREEGRQESNRLKITRIVKETRKACCGHDTAGGNVGGGGGLVMRQRRGDGQGLDCEGLCNIPRILNSLLKMKKMLETSSEVD